MCPIVSVWYKNQLCHVPCCVCVVIVFCFNINKVNKVGVYIIQFKLLRFKKKNKV
jgi:hypothetical protein